MNFAGISTAVEDAIASFREPAMKDEIHPKEVIEAVDAAVVTILAKFGSDATGGHTGNSIGLPELKAAAESVGHTGQPSGGAREWYRLMAELDNGLTGRVTAEGLRNFALNLVPAAARTIA
eukprot:SAG31_NODE_21373_length_551_cov_1.099558_1_plen_120_part_10